MRLATAMSDIEWLGQHGGKLALAFAAGCIATFGFMMAVGSFLWKIIGGHRKDRISELEGSLETERQNCASQLQHMADRICQLETLFTMRTGIKMAQPAPATALAQTRSLTDLNE